MDSDARIDSKSILVTLACFFGAIYSSYLLYRDIHDMGARTGVQMAKLERSESKVRFKPASSFVWGSARAHEDLYLKDSVQTAPRGGASIRFNDGTLLELGENSLIIVDSIENLSLSFLHGSAVLRTQAGDSRITLGQDGKAVLENLPIGLLQPEPLAEFYTPEKKPKTISFEWGVNPKASQAVPAQVTIQISSDRAFRGKDVKSLEVPKDQHQLIAEVAPGKYYWRVLSGEHSLSEPSQFRVDSAVSLKPLFPSAAQKIPLFEGASSVQFRWVPASEEVNKVEYDIQISDDPTFKKLVKAQSIAATSGGAVLNGLPEGEHLWRMVSKYPGLVMASPVEKFELNKVANVSIELAQPLDNAVLELKKEMRFSWNSEVRGIDYRLQIKSDAQTHSADSHMSKDYLWKDTKSGIYQWKVEALSNEKVIGGSAWRGFSIVDGAPIGLRYPAAKQEFYYWTDLPTFDFKWTRDEKAQAYLVEVAGDPDFKEVVSAEAQNAELPSRALQFKPGQLYWRVKALDASKHVIKISGVEQFVYGPFPPLRAPASAKPDSGSVINPMDMEKTPFASWTPVEDAQAYEFTIKQGDKVVHQETVKATQAEFKDLAAGQFQFSVRAIDKLQRKGEPLPDHAFQITFGDPLGAPEAVSPEVQ
jgi:hypothetical protein